MATINGTTGSNSSHWKYYLVCTEQNIDVSANTSKVKVDVYLEATSYSRAVRGNISATHTVTINGTNYTFTTTSYTVEKNSRVLLGSVTSNAITHNADGSKTVSVSASSPDLAQASGYGPYSGSASDNMTLTTIPRASSVTCADGNIGSSTTININRASSNFTHTLKYSFGSLSGTIVAKTAETSYGWTIPTSFYAQIPNSNSGQGTITCETYSGNTLIGTKTCTFNAFVVNSNPTITATVVDDNSTTTALTGDSSKLIKYYSNAKVTMTTTARNSATIVSKKVTCGDGKTSTSSPATLNGVESGTFNLSCTDSRGNVGTSTITKTLINYIKLAVTSLTIARISSTSNTVNVSLRGNYFNSSFGAVSNTLTLKWRYRIKSGTWQAWNTVTATKSGNTFSYSGTLGTAFDYQTAYEFQVQVQDRLVTSTISRELTEGVPLFDIWKGNFKINGELHASYFLKYQGNTPTNLNEAKTFGIYHLGGTYTNAPTNSSIYGILIVYQNRGGTWTPSEDTTSGSSWIWQEIRTTGGAVYRRHATNTSSSWSSWSREYSEVTLYENATGTTGTVTLSESAENFGYLEIFSRSSDNNAIRYPTVKISNPNGKKFIIMTIQPDSNDSQMYVTSKQYAVNATSITVDTRAQTNTIMSGSGNTVSVYDNTEIYKVVGYR